MTGHHLRSWRLEYECNGAPFRWTGQALNERAADALARHVLDVEWSEWFDKTAVLVICIETADRLHRAPDGLLDSAARVLV